MTVIMLAAQTVVTQLLQGQVLLFYFVENKLTVLLTAFQKNNELKCNSLGFHVPAEKR